GADFDDPEGFGTAGGSVAYFGTMTPAGRTHMPHRHHWSPPATGGMGLCALTPSCGGCVPQPPLPGRHSRRNHPEIWLWSTLWGAVTDCGRCRHGAWPGAHEDELIAVL